MTNNVSLPDYNPSTVLWVALGANLLAFILCAVDKNAAKRRAWRVSEATFFVLALIGGWPGLFVAMRKFRHKTAKASFKWRAYFAAAVNVGVVGYMFFSVFF